MPCRSLPPTCGTTRSRKPGAPTEPRGAARRCARSSNAASRIPACYATRTRPGSCPLLRQHPFDEGPAVLLARLHRRMLLARAQFGHDLRLGVGIALVLLGDVLERRAHLLGAHVVAAHAA